MNKKLLFLPLITFLVCVTIFIVQLKKNLDGNNPTLLPSVMVGRQVPPFKLEDLFKDGTYYTQDLFKGKPMLLNVWASWCPTCFDEHTELAQLASQGVPIVGMDYKDTRDKAINWLDKNGNPYTHVMFDPTGQVGMDLGVYGTPETFFIDAKGVIRYRQVGDITAQNWKTTLEPIYNQMVKEAKEANQNG